MFTGSLLLSLVATGALAQAPAPASPPAAAPAARDFATLDRNKDGRVSSAEAAVSVELNADFAKLDTNSDTYLSSEEFHKWAKASKPAAPAK
jgi:Ca2+-binding EF-hand superfamily protein